MDYEIAFKEGLPYDCTCPVCDQKHAESCEYHGIPCTNECGKIIPEKEMAAHLVECQKKRTKCTYCNMLIKTPSMEKHLKICPRMIISCPFQCGLNDRPREEVCHLNSKFTDVQPHIRITHAFKAD
ncbi:TRAF-type zinc finger [Ancylostoma duodenale]|uniref:TRAF-type zinc finger n=1 Tax=Ancylostoma duodenale TaxID=51022 RepID=A0A0C2FTN8_9BILA|nr:TRAF-type zinc finger [Ancylostoma duodenale]